MCSRGVNSHQSHVNVHVCESTFLGAPAPPHGATDRRGSLQGNINDFIYHASILLGGCIITFSYNLNKCGGARVSAKPAGWRRLRPFAPGRQLRIRLKDVVKTYIFPFGFNTPCSGAQCDYNATEDTIRENYLRKCTYVRM